MGFVFHHHPQGGEWNNSQVKVIKPNQSIIPINPDQILELTKKNQIIEKLSRIKEWD